MRQRCRRGLWTVLKNGRGSQTEGGTGDNQVSVRFVSFSGAVFSASPGSRNHFFST